MKQVLKTCLSLGEGGCEQSEQTEGGMCALFLASQSSAVTPFSRLRRQFPQGGTKNQREWQCSDREQ